jgi:hypothetical protein
VLHFYGEYSIYLLLYIYGLNELNVGALSIDEMGAGSDGQHLIFLWWLSGLLYLNSNPKKFL